MPHFQPRSAALLAAALLAPSALAWTPALDEQSAQAVIDMAYDRPVADARPTFLQADLSVEGGAFKSPEAVTLFDGSEACLAAWKAEPTRYEAYGSRPTSVLATGQADSLFFEARAARNAFKNLSVAEAMSEEARAERLEGGLLRVDIAVKGLPAETARNAYLVRLKSGDVLVAPARQSYVADWEQGAEGTPEAGLWSGTIVYYFEVEGEDGALAFDPNAPAQLLIRTEARSNCAYSVPLDLGRFI